MTNQCEEVSGVSFFCIDVTTFFADPTKLNGIFVLTGFHLNAHNPTTFDC